MKRNKKTFWTLDRHHAAGFTLVELIVVIAILAILAGVGIPVYSGYIKKANMQVDRTLAGEIENALLLAHYAGKLNKGATVIVYYGENGLDVATSDDVAAANGQADSADAAMVAAFGSNYAENLRLKYDGWDKELGAIADSDAYENVQNSSFKGDNLGYMLEDVQKVVTLLGTALTGGSVNIKNSELEAYLIAQGLDMTDPNVVSNAAVLYVADKISSTAGKAPAEGEVSNKDAILDAWSDLDQRNFTQPSTWLNTIAFADTLGKNSLHSAAAGYARAEALANFIDREVAAQGLSSNFAASLREASEGTDPDSMIVNGMAGVDAALAAAFSGNATAKDKAVMDAYAKYFGFTLDYTTGSMIPVTGVETQATKDAKAFLSYMDGIVAATDSLLEDTDLTSANYYTDGNILSYVTGYLDIGKALADAGYTGKGAFAFVYSGEEKDPVKCAPLDY